MARPSSSSSGRSHFRNRTWGTTTSTSIIILNQLAIVYVEQAKYAEAEALYLRSIAIHERKTPDENLDLAETAEKYAELLRLMKRMTMPTNGTPAPWRFATPSQPRRPRPGPIEVQQEFRGFK